MANFKDTTKRNAARAKRTKAAVSEESGGSNVIDFPAPRTRRLPSDQLLMTLARDVVLHVAQARKRPRQNKPSVNTDGGIDMVTFYSARLARLLHEKHGGEWTVTAEQRLG